MTSFSSASLDFAVFVSRQFGLLTIQDQVVALRDWTKFLTDMETKFPVVITNTTGDN